MDDARCDARHRGGRMHEGVKYSNHADPHTLARTGSEYITPNAFFISTEPSKLASRAPGICAETIKMLKLSCPVKYRGQIT